MIWPGKRSRRGASSHRRTGERTDVATVGRASAHGCGDAAAASELGRERRPMWPTCAGRGSLAAPRQRPVQRHDRSGEGVKAWVQHHLGEPCDVLRIEEVDVPTPGPGQVVLEVAATAVGFSDLLHCRGEYQESTPLPFTPGTEMVGVVSAAGPGTSIGVGERVIALSTGGRGSLGQYALAEANLCFAADDQMTESEAACFL